MLFRSSFSGQKGDFIGREPLAKQYEAFKRIQNRDFSDLADLPRRVMPVTLLDKGVMRAGMPVYKGDKHIGYVTSGTMVPYYRHEGEGLQTVILDETAKRSIGLALVDSDTLEDDEVRIDVRGRKLKAVIPPYHMRVDAPPFARPIIYRPDEEEGAAASGDRAPKALELIGRAIEIGRAHV